jgi:hypothetical protein
MSQSVLKLRSEHTGFCTDHVTIQTSRLSLLRLKGEAKLNLYQRMVDRFERNAWCALRSRTSKTPVTGPETMAAFEAVSERKTQPQPVPLALNDVGAGYFLTMKTEILGGREFVKSDWSLNVCILNQSAAKALFRNELPRGGYARAADDHEFKAGTTCRVIGIAADAKFADAARAATHDLLSALARAHRHKSGKSRVLINSESKLAAMVSFRKTLAELAPTVPIVTFVTQREQMDAALGSEELITLLSKFFGFVSLVLSTLGLYGLLSSVCGWHWKQTAE